MGSLYLPITPSAPALNPLASAYFGVVQGLQSLQQSRINRFFNALTAAGVDSVLSDCCFLRAGQNTGNNSPKTLRGITGVLDGSPGWTSDGIILLGDGTQRGLWSTTSVSAHSVIFDVAGVPTGQLSDATIGGLGNSLGINTCASLLELSGTGLGIIYTRQGSATTTSGIGTTNDAFCVHYYNPLPQVVAYTNDNTNAGPGPTIKTYVDGFLTNTFTTGNTQVTSNLDRIFIGSRLVAGPAFDTPYKGTCAAWLIFNRVLTQTEVTAVFQAMRHLDDKRVNIVTDGDSLTCQLSDAVRSNGNWPANLVRTSEWSGLARLCNAAANGTTAATGDATFATRCNQYIQPSDSAQVILFFCLYGTNDLLNSFTAVNILISLTSIWRKAKALGAKVIALTVPATRPNPPGVGLTVAQDAQRVILNTSIRGLAGIEVDGVIDVDAFLSALAPSSLYVDDIHTNNSGNIAIANFIARGITTYIDGGNLSSTVAGATTGAFNVNMISGVITLTPTGNCTLNAVGAIPGQLCSIIILTAGVASFNVTFGTNFISQGVLATGVTAGKTFSVSFRCNNSLTWVEDGARGPAM